MDTTSKLLDDILNRRIIKGRVTSQGDLEQWTCLQKIIAIDKLIRAYAIAFKTYGDEFQDTKERFNALTEEWNSFREEIRDDYSLLTDEWSEYKASTTEDFNVYYNNLNAKVIELEGLIEEVRTQYGDIPQQIVEIRESITNTKEKFRNFLSVPVNTQTRCSPNNKLYKDYHIRLFPSGIGTINYITINNTTFNTQFSTDSLIYNIDIIITQDILQIEGGIGGWFCNIIISNNSTGNVELNYYRTIGSGGQTADSLGKFTISVNATGEGTISGQYICENLIMED